MLIFTKTDELQSHLHHVKARGNTLGFVPTMGALHNGHLSLIERSKNVCDLTICSVFVNPMQFNDKVDLEKYPRMPEMDAQKLEKAACDILFMPSVDEVYRNEEIPVISFGYLDRILEGEHRPGHFDGVARVVKRLFDIISPDQAFFGSKDYQQVMIVRALVKELNLPVKVVACPILREHDGLAMSSRNALLTAEERALARNIPLLLEESKQIALHETFEAAKTFLTKAIAKIPALKLDYFEICDAETLLAAKQPAGNATYIALIAVVVGKIRLIDNLILN